jgi:ATP-dependent RNA helicase DeaD
MSILTTESIGPDVGFEQLPLSSELRQAIEELGYVSPTPVQQAVFDPATSGIDLVVQARTGTGKTAAFGMPIVDHLVRRNLSQVQALVLCPTRELALQVSRELSVFGKHRGVHVTAVYGGAPMGPQISEIQDNAQVVVGTPGRVLDHLQRGTFEPSAVRVLVLDESDEMLSMGFLPQINDILSFLPEAHQTLLFSATLPPDIQRMAETRLHNPQFRSSTRRTRTVPSSSATHATKPSGWPHFCSSRGTPPSGSMQT